MEENKDTDEEIDKTSISQTINKFFIGLAITEALTDASIEQLVEICKILGI